MREQLKVWIKAFLQWAVIFGVVWSLFFLASYGWYSAKSIANLQDNIRILDAYIAKQGK